MAEDIIEEGWLKRVRDQESLFSELVIRMDKDKELLIQKPYTMFDKDNREQPDVENTTLNDAAVFSNTVTSRLAGTNLQVAVEGKGMTDKQTSLVEDFCRDIGLAFEASLQPRDISTWKKWDVEQLCHRGRVAARITIDDDGDGKLADNIFLPMDTRYLVYEYGLKGLKWFAYKTLRSADKVKDEYGTDAIPGDNKSVISQVTVTDIWDDKEESVFIEEAPQGAKPHDYGEPPAIIQMAPTGLMFMDQDRILQNGESIFVLARNLFKEKHFFASVLKTLTVMSFLNGLQLEIEPGQKMKKPTNPPYGTKAVMPILKGSKGYFNMPITDVHNSARMFYSILDTAIKKATLPDVSYGIISYPTSAVGMIEQKEAEEPVYLPRLQGLAEYRQRVYRMAIKQFIGKELKLKLGQPGFQTEYNYKELDKDYSLTVSLDMRSPKQDMVNISSAAAVGDLLSDDTKRREYLKLDDPDAEEAKIWAEKAALVSPAVAKYKIIKGLLAQGEKVEANLMAKELGMSIKEIESGKVAEPAPAEIRTPPKQMMPMFAGQGGGMGGETPPELEIADEKDE